MIYIEEKKSLKLSGDTSLFVYFEYNQKAKDYFNTITVKRYNKKDYSWEFQLTDLAKLLDLLCCFDDVGIKLLEETKQENKLIPKNKYKVKPFKHQLEAIEYGINNDKWLLLDSQGLGKTLESIYIAEELYNLNKVKKCLIICGFNALKGNWKSEINKYSKLSCHILGERINRKGKIVYDSVSKRVKDLEEDTDNFFLITNVETIRSKEFVETFKKSNIDMIIFDEIHKCSNPSSWQGENLLKLNAPYKLGLTGTLMTTSPLNLYLPLKWIEINKCCLSTFKSQFCVVGELNEILGYKNLDYLQSQVDNHSLRRTLTEVFNDFPSKTIIPEYLELDETNQKWYKNTIELAKEQLLEKNKNNEDNKLKGLELVLLTKLRECTACPSMLFNDKKLISNKVERCVDLANSILSDKKQKLVIFSTFKETCYVLQELLREYKPIVIVGETRQEDVDKYKEEFQNNEENRILIATWQKMGTGQTLTRASYMIFVDTPFNFSNFDQACDRIWRIGAKNNVVIYNLIAKNTIDERVQQLLENKKVISEYIIDHKEHPDLVKLLYDHLEEY